MDDFLILLQAKLDEAKSKNNISSDIDKLQSQLDKLKLEPEIDSKSVFNLIKQIESTLNQKIVINNIEIDKSNVADLDKQRKISIEKVRNTIKEIKSQIDSLNVGRVKCYPLF